MKWTCRKFRDDYIIRSPDQIPDVARVYSSQENARKIRCVPELIAHAKEIKKLLEQILRSTSADETLKAINKNKIKELLRVSNRILKRA
jgi:hypothetical protein